MDSWPDGVKIPSTFSFLKSRRKLILFCTPWASINGVGCQILNNFGFFCDCKKLFGNLCDSSLDDMFGRSLFYVGSFVTALLFIEDVLFLIICTSGSLSYFRFFFISIYSSASVIKFEIGLNFEPSFVNLGRCVVKLHVCDLYLGCLFHQPCYWQL